MLEEKLATQSLNIPISGTLHHIFSDLHERGHKALIVGGAVRDAIMGHKPKDIDVETYGTHYDDLVGVLNKYGRTNLVGKSFGVVKFSDPEGNDYDFSLPRRDSKSGTGHKDFRAEFDPNITPKEAASRRDFTMNSIAYDPLTHELHDYFHGQQDIHNKILRHTSEAFSEDPLRVLRGMQFSSRFGMQVHPDTAKESMRINDQFSTLPKERVGEEFMKLAKGDEPGRGMDYLHETGWLKHFPAIHNLRDVPQDPKWHPEGDVFEHTKHTMNAAAKIATRENLSGDERATLILGGLTHDFGKATHTQFEDGRWRAHGHDTAGAPIAKEFLDNIGIKPSITEHIVPMVAEHMQHLNFEDGGSPRMIRRLAQRVRPASIKELSRVMEADYSGRPPLPGGMPEPAKRMLHLAESSKVTEEPMKPLIQGRDIMPYFHDKPGPWIGEHVKAAYEDQMNGEINTPEEAQGWLKKRFELGEQKTSAKEPLDFCPDCAHVFAEDESLAQHKQRGECPESSNYVSLVTDDMEDILSHLNSHHGIWSSTTDALRSTTLPHILGRHKGMHKNEPVINRSNVFRRMMNPFHTHRGYDDIDQVSQILHEQSRGPVKEGSEYDKVDPGFPELAYPDKTPTYWRTRQVSNIAHHIQNMHPGVDFSDLYRKIPPKLVDSVRLASAIKLHREQHERWWTQKPNGSIHKNQLAQQFHTHPNGYDTPQQVINYRFSPKSERPRKIEGAYGPKHPVGSDESWAWHHLVNHHDPDLMNASEQEDWEDPRFGPLWFLLEQHEKEHLSGRGKWPDLPGPMRLSVPHAHAGYSDINKVKQINWLWHHQGPVKEGADIEINRHDYPIVPVDIPTEDIPHEHHPFLRKIRQYAQDQDVNLGEFRFPKQRAEDIEASFRILNQKKIEPPFDDPRYNDMRSMVHHYQKPEHYHEGETQFAINQRRWPVHLWDDHGWINHESATIDMLHMGNPHPQQYAATMLHELGHAEHFRENPFVSLHHPEASGPERIHLEHDAWVRAHKIASKVGVDITNDMCEHGLTCEKTYYSEHLKPGERVTVGKAGDQFERDLTEDLKDPEFRDTFEREYRKAAAQAHDHPLDFETYLKMREDAEEKGSLGRPSLRDPDS